MRRKFSSTTIDNISQALATKPNNALFIEQLLSKLSEITAIAIKRNDKSVYLSATQWYGSIVFDRLAEKGERFQLTYLDLFDRYLFRAIQQIISRDQFSLFRAFVSSLVDGVNPLTYDQGKLWDYHSLLIQANLPNYAEFDEKYQVFKSIAELADSQEDLGAKEELSSWLQRFDELKKVIVSQLNETQMNEARELEEAVKYHVEAQFKYNNLLKIVSAASAYCVFKQKPRYLKYLLGIQATETPKQFGPDTT